MNEVQSILLAVVGTAIVSPLIVQLISKYFTNINTKADDSDKKLPVLQGQIGHVGDRSFEAVKAQEKLMETNVRFILTQLDDIKKDIRDIKEELRGRMRNAVPNP